MKTTRFLNMMAASLVGVAFMSCSSQDDVLTPAGQTYTMSVTAQKGGDGTRALNLDGTTLNATWTAGDEVKVYNSTSELIGTLTAQSAGTTTTLTGDLTTLPENGATLTLKYLSPSYSQQDGTLTGADNSIDKVCDYATATVTATVSGTNVTTDAAAFQNQQAIVKFTLVDKATTNTAISPTALTINDGTDDIVTLTDIPAGTYTTNGEGVLFVAIPGFTGKTITLTATVGSDTYTCTTSEAKTLGNGKYYGVTAQMAKQASVPEGAISGVFSVNSNGDKVYFSKGNLYYNANTTTKWYFATNQWDYVSTATYPMAHFTWGNINNPTFNGETFVEGTDNLSGTTDWGSNIGSGWRTLSMDEWRYVLGTNEGAKRSGATVGETSHAYYTKATINTGGTSVVGVILFPDGATFADGEATWGEYVNGIAGWSTQCTTAQLTALEAKGCVFLPAAGHREYSSVSSIGSEGDYWTSTAYGTVYAKVMFFTYNTVKADGQNYRNKAFSVRLVKDVAAAAPAVPAGALSGKFSVSATKKVNFSKGNLKYNGSTWSFFDNQYDYFTTHDGTNWDRFGWSTSATDYGMNTSDQNSTYSGNFVDWGSNSDLQSALGTGWRTLTGGSSGEWQYLLDTRSASTVGGTENGRYAKAKVNGVPGMILFPDTYTHPDGVTAPTGVNAAGDTGWTGNSYTAADWTKMESAGCVFLPAAGCRYKSSVYFAGARGYYWSATPSGTDYAYYMDFDSGSRNTVNTYSRYYGYSVRLVREVE